MSNWDAPKISRYNHFVVAIIQLLNYCFILYMAVHLERLFFLIFLAYLILLNCCALHKVITCSPGVIRKRKIGDCPFETLEFADGSYAKVNVFEDTREIGLADSKKVTQKFCMVCNCFRPVGTAHCTECDGCILEKDHHCSALGVCVGRNNLRSFCVFIATECILAFSTVLLILKVGTYIFRRVRVLVGLFAYTYFFLSLAFAFFLMYYMVIGLMGMSSRKFILSKKKTAINFNNIYRLFQKKAAIGS